MPEMPNIEPWRSMEPKDQMEFMACLDISLRSRWERGEAKYDSALQGFQGNPLDHAIEEALDLVLYLWMAKRQKGEGLGSTN